MHIRFTCCLLNAMQCASSKKVVFAHVSLQLEAELQECRVEVQGLRVALSHLQKDNKSHIQEKVNLCLCVHRWISVTLTEQWCTSLCVLQAGLQQQCLELRSQVISLRSQLDTSQAVQKDFVQLSQSLQVLHWFRISMENMLFICPA